MLPLSIIAVAIGISLGLIGAGGAIVAVPALVYIGGIEPRLASGYALFMVAVASAIASSQHIRERRVDIPSVLAFGSTTIMSILLVRRFVAPMIPPAVQMIAFGCILLVAAIRMLRTGAPPNETSRRPELLAGYGAVIGTISGILGVGGGFLMTPALVLWAGLDMKRAVATSLVLISINSAVGVAADIWAGTPYDWPLVLGFTGLTTLGILSGMALSHRIDGSTLRKGFGWVVL
ncbi:MAG: hypothetical protein RIR53_609, partial [Bacteroidota bacterium]